MCAQPSRAALFCLSLAAVAGAALSFVGVNNMPKSLKDEALDAVPDGTTVAYSDLVKNADPGVVQALAWANPQSVSRNGNHFVITCGSASSMSQGGITINIGQKIEFDLDPTSPDLAVTNLTGVTASKGSVGPYSIRSATIAVDSSGNTTVSGKLEVSRWLPKLPFTVKFDKDGNPLP